MPLQSRHEAATGPPWHSGISLVWRQAPTYAARRALHGFWRLAGVAHYGSGQLDSPDAHVGNPHKGGR
jgi:hypothetical protein